MGWRKPIDDDCPYVMIVARRRFGRNKTAEFVSWFGNLKGCDYI